MRPSSEAIGLRVRSGTIWQVDSSLVTRQNVRHFAAEALPLPVNIATEASSGPQSWRYSRSAPHIVANALAQQKLVSVPISFAKATRLSRSGIFDVLSSIHENRTVYVAFFLFPTISVLTLLMIQTTRVRPVPRAVNRKSGDRLNAVSTATASSCERASSPTRQNSTGIGALRSAHHADNVTPMNVAEIYSRESLRSFCRPIKKGAGPLSPFGRIAASARKINDAAQPHLGPPPDRSFQPAAGPRDVRNGHVTGLAKGAAGFEDGTKSFKPGMPAAF
jgi:hypothetical protein